MKATFWLTKEDWRGCQTKEGDIDWSTPLCGQLIDAGIGYSRHSLPGSCTGDCAVMEYDGARYHGRGDIEIAVDWITTLSNLGVVVYIRKADRNKAWAVSILGKLAVARIKCRLLESVAICPFMRVDHDVFNGWEAMERKIDEMVQQKEITMLTIEEYDKARDVLCNARSLLRTKTSHQATASALNRAIINIDLGREAVKRVLTPRCEQCGQQLSE